MKEDIHDIVNVFKIYILTDELLGRDESIMLRQFFGNLVDNSSITNFIIQEFVQKDLYEHVEDSWDIKSYQRMLEKVGSSLKFNLSMKKIGAIYRKVKLNLIE